MVCACSFSEGGGNANILPGLAERGAFVGGALVFPRKTYKTTIKATIATRISGKPALLKTLPDLGALRF